MRPHVKGAALAAPQQTNVASPPNPLGMLSIYPWYEAPCCYIRLGGDGSGALQDVTKRPLMV